MEKYVSANPDPIGSSRQEIEGSATVGLANPLEFPVHDTRVLLRTRMLRGGAMLLSSTAFVSVTNLLYNIVIARRLGAVGFGHATAIYTSLMLLSAVTLAFQLVCSKFVARNPSLPAKLAIYNDLLRHSWPI